MSKSYFLRKAEDNAKSEKNVSRRNTRSKALILGFLKNLGNEHITAEELIDKLKACGTPVSKSTAYRFLSQLEEDGIVKKYFTGENSKACYSYIGSESECNEHFHLCCKDCGKITHFENPSLQKLLKKLDNANGFSIDIAESPFYGICKNCIKNKEGNKNE